MMIGVPESLPACRGQRQTSSDAPRTVLISGAGGLVGSALIPELRSAGYRVLCLVRREVRDAASEIRWDPLTGSLEPERLRGVDAVVNLAGRGIAEGRWTRQARREIRDSRVFGTGQICRAIAGLRESPPVLINASAIGYYGDRGQGPLDESSCQGEGFLAETTAAWEAATQPAVDCGARVVLMRIGLVLSARGGALAKMLLPFRLGLGGRLGNGRQSVSWISLDDLVSAVVFTLERSRLAGPVNAVAPTPVTNLELTRALGRELSRPTVLPLPEFAIGILFGDMGRELLLSSAHVIPRRLEQAGFRFRHATLALALEAVLGRNS